MTTLFRSNSSKTVLAAALAVAISGCVGDILGVDGGRVQFVLTPGTATATAAEQVTDLDPTFHGNDGGSDVVTTFDRDDDHDHDHGHRGSFYFQSANLTFSSILARDFDGVLVDVAMELPTTVDVVRMEGGNEVVLPDGELPPATYDQLVVVMTAVQGVTRDGTTITIEPPGGGWTAIVPVCPFTVEDGATTVVGLQLMVHRAFRWRNNRFHFEPVFECEGAEDTEPDTN